MQILGLSIVLEIQRMTPPTYLAPKQLRPYKVVRKDVSSVEETLLKQKVISKGAKFPKKKIWF